MPRFTAETGKLGFTAAENRDLPPGSTPHSLLAAVEILNTNLSIARQAFKLLGFRWVGPPGGPSSSHPSH